MKRAVTRYNPACALRIGMKGFCTLALRQTLSQDKATPELDREFGANTRAAVASFQTLHMLTPTGVAEQKNVSLLGLPVAKTHGNPATAGQSIIRITGGSVHIRSGPGTEYPSRRIASKDEALECADLDSWVPVVLNGAICWVSQRYCTVEEGRPWAARASRERRNQNR